MLIIISAVEPKADRQMVRNSLAATSFWGRKVPQNSKIRDAVIVVNQDPMAEDLAIRIAARDRLGVQTTDTT